jgi:uncharacterized protein (TIGR02117 family)
MKFNPVKIARALALSFAGLVGLYFASALIGSFVPANSGWVEPPSGVTIYIETNGVHTGIVVPAAAAGIDLSLIFRPTDLPNPSNAGNWFAIGWGDRDFYLNTPTWADLSVGTAGIALTGSGRSLIHVDHLDQPYPGADQRAVRITPAQYRALIAGIVATLKRGPDSRPVALAGYNDLDVFYEADGHYSVFYTCNSWVAAQLARAGIKAPLWTPFSGGVMRWF